MKNKKLLPILLIVVILIIDQVSKIWIKLNFCLGEEVEVFPWFRIHFLENEGFAFGFRLGEENGKLVLSLLRLIAIVALGWYVNKLIKEKQKTIIIVAFSLILAGAIGNIIDSIFYGVLFSDSFFSAAKFLPSSGGYSSFLHGHVVDMLYFPIIDGFYPEWFPIMGGKELLFFRPVFNIADSSICIGFIMFLICNFSGNGFGKAAELKKQEEQQSL